MSKAAPSRGWLYGPIAVFVILVATYSAYWFFARGEITKGIDEWIAAERASGVAIEFASKEVVGFPYRFALNVERPSYRDEQAAIDWQGERLELIMQPWNYRHAIARAPGRNEVLVSGVAGTALIDAKSAMSFRWNEDGITDIGLTLNEAELITDGADISVLGLHTNYALADGYTRFGADWEAVSVSPELIAGQAFAFLGPQLQTSRLRVQFKGIGEAEPINAQQERTMDLAQLQLNWGALKLGAKGQFDITPAGYLDGPLQIRIDDAETLATAIADARLGRAELGLIVQALGTASQDGKFLTLNIKDGALTMLGFPIANLPQIAPPAVAGAPAFPVQ